MEMQTRALVTERAQRNLLLLIEGTQSDDMLLNSLVGISAVDFETLRSLGLITQVVAPGARFNGGTSVQPGSISPAVPAVADPPAEPPPFDDRRFTAALTAVISTELGPHGFLLTLAVEKAGTNEELQAVAQRALAQIREHKGDAAAAAARRTLYGD